jgi:hypothetical protein
MESIKNIIVPIDFSEDTEAILKAANNFGQMFDSKIHLVNFFEISHDVKHKHPKKAVLGHEEELR